MTGRWEAVLPLCVVVECCSSNVVSSSTILLFFCTCFSYRWSSDAEKYHYIFSIIFHYIFEIIMKIWNLKGKRFWPLDISNRSCEVAGRIFGTMNFGEVWLRLYFFKCFLMNCGLWDKLFQWNCPLRITKCTLKKNPTFSQLTLV